MLLIDIAGWLGGVLVLAAYAMNTYGRMFATSSAYQWLNAVGAAGLTVNAAANGAYPLVAVDGIWTMIALVALWRLARPAASPAEVE